MKIEYILTEDQMETLCNYFAPDSSPDEIQDYMYCEWLDTLIDNLLIGTY